MAATWRRLWAPVAALLLKSCGGLDAGCSVTLYDGTALDGTSAVFTLGEYPTAQLVSGGMADNSVSSLTVVGRRCVATLYNGAALETSVGNWYAQFPEGEYDLAAVVRYGGVTDQASSLKVWRTSCAVSLFANDNFDTSGWFITLMAHTWTQADISVLSNGNGDNVVSSVRVAGPRCTASLYEGNTAGAGSWQADLPPGDYTTADLVLRGGVDDQMSSVDVVIAGCVATIYDDGALDSTGWHLSLTAGDYDLTTLSNLGGGTGANVVSSLRVSGYGCSATVFQTNNLDAGGGWSETFTEGDYPTAQFTAGTAVDNQLNSIRVSYTASVFTLSSSFTGNSGASSLATFFHASIGEQWTYDGTGLTLTAAAGSHEQAILRSVAFTLPEGTQITVSTHGGGPGAIAGADAATQGAVVEDGGTVDANGYVGVAISDFDTNMYLLSKSRTTSGSTAEDIVFTTSELNLYHSRKVVVDIVDTYTGADGYLAVTTITIAVACTAVTTVDSCQYDVSLCAEVMPGANCLVQCQLPYTGTATSGACPAGNVASSTALTFSGSQLPSCTLPCPNPAPIPTGYLDAGSNTVSCDTGSGYTGTAVKSCTVDGACSRQIAVSGCALPGVAGAAGDPVAHYGDLRAEFKVPYGELTPLLEVPDMRVLARGMKGRGEEQWLDQMVVVTPQGEEVLRVTIKPGLFDFNRSSHPPQAFETLEVRMDWWRPGVVMENLPPANEYFKHWRGLHLAFARARNLPLTDAPRRELAMVVSRFATVYIASSSASEFYEEPFLAYRYAHLDLLMGDMRNRSSFRGLLPELWGISPQRAARLGEASAITM